VTEQASHRSLPLCSSSGEAATMIDADLPSALLLLERWGQAIMTV
jgi:hypothetical protein